MKTRDRVAIKAALALTWAPAAYATTVTLGASLTGVPLLAWLLVLVLSGISGTAALLGKLKDTQPERPAVFICAHLLGSMLAGVLTFFVLSGMGTVQDFYQVAIISVAAYTGGRLLDAAADGLAAGVAKRVAAAMGKKDDEGEDK